MEWKIGNGMEKGEAAWPVLELAACCQQKDLGLGSTQRKRK
jgi:hypothetical protein